MRAFVRILAAVVVAYLVLCGALLAVMMQPPEQFARVAARMPMPLFMLLPFEPLWSIARGGHLHTGDPAPDFDLETLDKTARVRLSSFRGQKPVVLVFGSFT
jgi:hypothetical protein